MEIRSSMPSPASPFVQLPPEIAQFFASSTPNAVTVRGPPGSGKTTFALSTLAAFPGRRIYVSTSVPRESLLLQFPWIASLQGRPIDFLEFLRYRTPSRDGGPDVDQMREVLQARAADLVDLSQVLSLPPPLFEALKGPPASSPLVVFDSWEGWVENLLGGTFANLEVGTTRWVLERSLLDQILRTGAHVVMVVERDDRNRFDYVVDGAVSLAISEFEGRQERWISLNKLRGVRVGTTSYPFTLEGATFRSIVPMSATSAPRSVRDEPSPGEEPGSLWPGSAAFAARFGRLPARGSLLVETDGETPARVGWVVVAPAVLAALRAGGRVVLRPPPGLATNEIWSAISSTILPSQAAAGLRLIDVPPGPDLAGVPAEVLPPSTDVLALTESAHHGSAIDFLRRGAGAPGLAVIFPHESFDPMSDAHTRDSYLGFPSMARRTGVILSAILLLRSDDPHIAQARVRSSVHLVVRARRGQFFLYGVRPWTPLYVLGVPAEGELTTSPYDLTPMV